MTPLRIAFVGYGNSADPRYVGGHQNYLRRLASGLTEASCKIDFFALQASCHWQGNETLPVYCPQSMGDLARALYDGCYDYVQFTRFPLRYYPALVRLLRYLRACKTTVGYLYLVYPPRALMRWLRHWLFKASFDLVFAASPRLYRLANRSGVQTALLLPIVPAPFFAVRRTAASPSATLWARYLGRLSDDKGIRELVLILEQLRASCPQLRVGVHGYYSMRSRQAKILAHLLQTSGCCDNCDLQASQEEMSYTPTAEKRVLQLLHSTDLLLLPYRSLDGATVDVPLLLLEAMAAGCAVIATPVADLVEIMADPDLVVPLRSLAGQAAKLTREGKLAEKQLAAQSRARVLGVDKETVCRVFLQTIQQRSR